MLLIKINPLILMPIYSGVGEYRRFFPPFGYNHAFRQTSPKNTIMPNDGHRADAS